MSVGNYDYPEASSASLAPLSEEMLATQRVREGRKVVLAHGRYWMEISPGLFDGIHWLSRRSPDEIRRPRGLCWGFRGALTDEYAAQATGSVPVHLMKGISGYSLASVPSKEIRRHLRAFPKQGVRIVHVNDPAVLSDQGYDVYCSWLSRTKHRAPPSRATYLSEVKATVMAPGWMVLAGMADNRLLGYSVQWAVDRTAYLHELVVSTEAMEMHLSAALNFCCLEVFRDSGVIDEVCPGLHMPEQEGLSDFKSRQGFEVTQVPSIVWMQFLAAAIVRRRFPYKYYRFTGQERA